MACSLPVNSGARKLGRKLPEIAIDSSERVLEKIAQIPSARVFLHRR
jgi:hypothetical protein